MTRDFQDLLDEAIRILERRGRTSLRALRRQLDIDDSLVADLRAELVDVLQVARGADNDVLEWVGCAAPETEAAPTPEHRQLAVMFCDVVGSTRWSEQLEAEDWREVLADFQRACAGTIERLDGHLAQYLGDGIMAYFGYPRTHEDDAERAARAALEIVAAVAELRDQVHAEHGVPLEVRVGLHVGRVVIGGVGTANRREVLALGEAPNVAARLQGLANPGEIVLSEDLRKLVAGRVETTPLGEHELKGLSRRVLAHRLHAVRDGADRLDAAEGLTTLVGRERELASLTAAWQAACGGRRSVVLLRGEAGIGKSRLVRALRERIDPAATIDIRCSQRYGATPFHPIRRVLEQLLGVDQETSFGALGAALEDLRLEPALAAAIAPILGIAPAAGEKPPAATASPQRQRQMALDAIAEILVRIGAGAPSLLMVEDLHWVDPSTREALGLVLRSSGQASLLVVMTTRPGDDLDWVEDSSPTVIDLQGLDADAIERIARNVAGDIDLPADLLAHVLARTEGVPLFVEELTKSLLESRSADKSSGTAGEHVPSSIYGCLMARLDRHPAGRAVAQVGAVIGREFSADLLSTVGRFDPTELQRGLRELCSAELVTELHTAGSSRYTFRHALIQDAAAQSLLNRRRRELHVSAATALTEQFPDMAAAEPQRVAHHLTEAGAIEAAIAKWQEAGLLAMQRSANLESIEFFDSALRLLLQTEPSATRDQGELALQTLRAIPLTLTRGWASPEVEASYRRAQALCADVGDSPQVFPMRIGLATYYIVRSDFVRACEMAADNGRMAATVGDAELQLEASVDLCTTSFYNARPHECLQHAHRVDELYDPRRHHGHVYLYGKDPLVVALVHAAMALWVLGDSRAAERHVNRAIAITEEWVHPFSNAWAWTVRSLLLHGDRRWQEAHAAAQRTIDIAGEQGFPNWLAQAQVYRGSARVHLGQIEAGIEDIEAGIALWERTGARLMRPFFHVALGEALLVERRTDEALARLTPIFDEVEGGREFWCAADLYRLRGVLNSTRGVAWDEVSADLSHAVAVAERQDSVVFALRAALDIAALCPASERANAQRRLRDILARVEVSATLPDHAAAHRLSARP